MVAAKRQQQVKTHMVASLILCPTGGKLRAGGSEDDDDDDDEELRHLEDLDSEELGDEDSDDVGPVLQVNQVFGFFLR